MKKAISALLLAMVLVMAPTAYADSTQDFTNSETYLRTSYSNDNYAELSVSGNTMTVGGKLQLDGLSGLLVMCGEQSHQYIAPPAGKHSPPAFRCPTGRSRIYREERKKHLLELYRG